MIGHLVETSAMLMSGHLVSMSLINVAVRWIGCLSLAACATAPAAFLPEKSYESEALEARHLLDPYCAPECGRALYGNEIVGNAKVLILTPEDYLIDYDPRWLNGIRKRFGRSAVIAVFAHEQGHVLDWRNGAPLRSYAVAELSADAWAGCALARGSYELTPTAAMFSTFPEDESHPAPFTRIAALYAGAKECTH